MFFHIFMSCADHPMVLALRPEPGAINVMHAFHSDDMRSWTHKGAMAYGVSSLGLDKVEEGLRITLIQEVRPPTWWEQVWTSKVYGYIYDGQSLSPKDWTVHDSQATAMIDPQFYNGAYWYISPPKGIVDPARSDTPIPIRNSQTEAPLYEAPRLADPSPVLFNQERHVFATQNGSVLQLSGDPLRPVDKHPGQNSLFNGTTVPFATVIDDTLLLLAQRNVNGRRLPVISSSADGKQWSQWKPIQPMPKELHACTSPVMGEDPAGGYILFCINEKPPPVNFKP